MSSVNGTSIETHTGKFFDFNEPRADDVDIYDVARALSMTVRFGGHVSRFYSVADHALRVAEIVWQETADAELAFAALHHDSHEAYAGDIPSPLRGLLGIKYELITMAVDDAIADAFGINVNLFDHHVVKAADAKALRLEANHLKPSRGTGPHWGHGAPLVGWIAPTAHPSTIEREFHSAHDRFRVAVHA